MKKIPGKMSSNWQKYNRLCTVRGKDKSSEESLKTPDILVTIRNNVLLIFHWKYVPFLSLLLYTLLFMFKST